MTCITWSNTFMHLSICVLMEKQHHEPRSGPDDSRWDVRWAECGWNIEPCYEVEPSIGSWEPVPPLVPILRLGSLYVQSQGTISRVIVEVWCSVPYIIAVDCIGHQEPIQSIHSHRPEAWFGYVHLWLVGREGDGVLGSITAVESVSLCVDPS